MPYRMVVSAELAKLFNVLSHPVRIRIIEELQREDLTVGELKEILGLTQAAVSQQMAVLRTHHLVSENRQGRNVFYHLTKPKLAKWIMEGLSFILPDTSEVEKMLSAIQSAREAWTPPAKVQAKSSKLQTKGKK